VQALRVAFQAKHSASYSEINQSASSLGMPMSAPGMAQRLNASSAQFMKSVLEIAVKEIWKGSSNVGGESAALKLQVSWEYSQGALDGIFLQDGYCQDKTSPYQNMELPAGALPIADLEAVMHLKNWHATAKKAFFGLPAGNSSLRSGRSAVF
jgi:hypothetical protein